MHVPFMIFKVAGIMKKNILQRNSGFFLHASDPMNSKNKDFKYIDED